MQATPFGCPAPQPCHVGLRAAFVEEDEPLGLKSSLLTAPFFAGLADVFAVLLGCAECLFLYVSPMSTST